LEEGFARLLPASLLIDIVNAGEHVDWDTSQAYCRSKASLGIRCNVKGRDPNGVVPADEFDSLRETLVEELRTITDSAGRAVFETVYDRHRVHGSDVANERSAPDIVVRPTDMVWEISDIVRERTVVETNKFNHSYDGLFIAAGDQINTDATPDPSVVDVTPTILSLFGIQPIESMDGRILEGLVTGLPADLEDPFVGTRTFVGDQTGVGVSDAVEEQLQEMGYLE
jgi:predicted AlkP superfamily phosphohydrolase/phosphomutase